MRGYLSTWLDEPNDGLLGPTDRLCYAPTLKGWTCGTAQSKKPSFNKPGPLEGPKEGTCAIIICEVA